ncbi:MAG: aminotransferase class V-fold PLP-dependent enzyme, partial [Candidatus Hydrogenedentes bacterium]|nr:aminotransferase class V-fold PLP-dependent enzyme [Candidatus Hydrogenedentota bacterium]
MNIQHELESKFGSEYGPEEEAAIVSVLRNYAPTSGQLCTDFEAAFANYCGTNHARAVSNGTAALFLSLLGVGVKPGVKMLTTPMTWIATAAAGVTLGAEVDFVDIDPETYNLDAAKLADKMTPDVKAIVPVHLYGQCCDMDAILEIAHAHGAAVIEDACHAVGA